MFFAAKLSLRFTFIYYWNIPGLYPGISISWNTTQYSRRLISRKSYYSKESPSEGSELCIIHANFHKIIVFNNHNKNEENIKTQCIANFMYKSYKSNFNINIAITFFLNIIILKF